MNMNMKTKIPGRSISRGFTLIELLVVIAIIAILAALLLPALSKAKIQSQGIGCMDNSRQLTLAWRMYSEDNKDVLLFGYSDSLHTNLVWSGPNGANDEYDESTTPTDTGNWDYADGIEKSLMWPYCGKSVNVWHCPADTSYGINPQHEHVQRPRSYSMSNWVGGNGDDPGNGYRGGWGLDANFLVYRKLTEFTQPGPATTFVLLDERQDSINDGFLVVQMTGFTGSPNGVEEIVDYPASYHNQAAGLGFGDGHSEIHKWVTKAMLNPPEIAVTTTPNSPDVFWLQYHSTRVQ